MQGLAVWLFVISTWGSSLCSCC